MTQMCISNSPFAGVAFATAPALRMIPPSVHVSPLPATRRVGADAERHLRAGGARRTGRTLRTLRARRRKGPWAPLAHRVLRDQSVPPGRKRRAMESVPRPAG